MKMKIFKKILSTVMAAVMFVAAVPMTSSAAVKLPDNEAIEFVDNLGSAWNLGNAFDAVNCTWLTNELDYESGWCGAKTTKSLIKAIKDMGFDTIRIPVSWHNHVDGSNKISSAWINRVKEVVDWSLDEGLYVILNVHHDVEKGYYYPTEAEYATSEKFLTAVWKQVAEKFKDYDERLIFETINEPRATGTNYEWWFPVNSPSAEVKESVECINKLNQKALDTIRAAGGKNKDRYILIPGYDTSVDGVTVKGFEMPEDTIKNRLIVDFHLYTKSAATYKQVIDKIYSTYVSKGIPAILTEYNLDPGPNKYNDNSAKYLSEWVAYARERGITCAIWDNNDVAYKLINRADAKWTQEEIAKAIVKAGEPNKKSSSDSTISKWTQEEIAKAIDKAGEPNKKSSSDSKNDDNDDKKSDSTISVTAKQSGFYSVISWDKVDGASKYRVYRATSKTGKKTLLKTTTSTKYTSSSGVVGKKYYFFVKSYDSATKKWSDYSDAEVLQLKKANAKTTISKATKSKSSVKLTWKAVKGGDKYRIYRADSLDGKKTTLATTDKLTYTDKGVKSGKTYYYFVKVYDAKTKQWSSYSSAKKVTIS